MFTASGIKHRRCCLQALYHKLYTQSSAPKDGRNYSPKHVELIEVINELSLLHLVGCLYYCINDARSNKHKNHGVFSSLFCKYQTSDNFVK